MESNKEEKKEEEKNSEKKDEKNDSKKEGTNEKKKQESNETYILSKGDYTVHVLVEEVKNLKLNGDKQPLPVVAITTMGKSQRTAKISASKGATEWSFGEHFYFDKPNMTEEMLDSEKIVIHVMDSRKPKRKDYFGIYEFDFEYIYNRPFHALKNYWLALCNPESEEMSLVKGYLKISISVLHQNDPRVELEMNLSESSDCVIPPQIKLSYKQISIYFFRAEDIPDMDHLTEKKVDRQCDGFIEVNYMGIKRSTSVVSMAANKDGFNNVIVWNEVIDIAVPYPTVSQKICMTMYDEDFPTDDIVGSLEFSVQDIIDGKYSDFFYASIYGSYKNERNTICDIMNYNPEYGSRYKGKILLKITAKDEDSPSSGIKKISDVTGGSELISKSKALGTHENLTLHAYLYEATLLPDKKKSYSIKIICNDYEMTFLAVELNKKKPEILPNVWNSYQFKTFNFLDGTSNYPDLFIGLYDGKDKNNQCLCFQRIPLAYFKGNYDTMIIKLIPEPSIGKIKGMKNSGIVKIKLCLAKADNSNFDKNRFLPPVAQQNEEVLDFENMDDDNLENAFKAKSQGEDHTIVACVYMSKGLVAAESNGTSDPYCRLTINDQTQSTSVKYGTVNAIWNELLKFDNIKFDLNDKATWPIILLDVNDKNKYSSDFPLGYTYIFLTGEKNIFINKIDTDEDINPTYYDLFQPKSNKPLGTILMKFYIFDQAHKNLYDELQRTQCFIPKTFPYSCEMNILGLRQLKPLSLFPVKKAFIKFDMNSLNVTGKPENTLQNIATIPHDPGCDPTINTAIKFDVQLPEKPLFIPELQCEVYDHLLSGMSKSLLGVFTINIQKIVEQTVKEIKADMSVTRKTFSTYLLEKSNIINTSENLTSENLDKASNDTDVNNEVRKSKIIDPVIQDVKNEYNPKESIELAEHPSNNNEVEEESKEEKETKETTIITTNKEGIKIPMDSISRRKSLASPEILLENIEESSYFVQKARTKIYQIPGASSNTEVKKRLPREFIVEDESNRPSENYFMKVGYYIKEEIKRKEAEINENGEPLSEEQKEEENKKLLEKMNDMGNELEQQILVNKNKGPKPNMHYRRYYGIPLEKVESTNFKLACPFTTVPLRRGKFEDKLTSSEVNFSENLCKIEGKILLRFNNEGQKVSVKQENLRESLAQALEKSPMYDDKTQESGRFKGLIKVAPKEILDNYYEKIDDLKAKNSSLLTEYSNYNNSNRIRQKILIKQNIYITLYVLRLTKLARKDLFDGLSDPYIKIYLGEKEIVNEQKNYQNDKIDCDWYKTYQIPCEIPGASILRIEVWDYDDIISDDLIGTTEIDIEDRYFDSNWSALIHKPIEIRPLYHPSIEGVQGNVSLWLEMTEQSLGQLPLWNIEPEPVIPLEVRFVVWDTDGMEMMDVEGTSDIYVIGYINDKEQQSTDIHFRCQTGVASFNWRMLLPYEVPNKSKSLYIKVYDKDLFASDDYICGGYININEIATISKLTNSPFKFNRSYFDSLNSKQKSAFGDIEFEDKEEDPEGIKFWIKCKKDSAAAGKVRCSLEILPKEFADINVVGKGREDPNFDPYLPPPTGRITFSLNPFKMLNQCVGPKFRRKFYCCICSMILMAYLGFMVPRLLLNALNPF